MTIDTKVRALLAKTIKAGATPGEQAAAVAKARELVAKHGLDPKAFTWPQEPKLTRKASKPARAPRRAPKAAVEPKKRVKRGDEVIELLRRKNGATIDEMVTRFGIQAHSLRAIISVESRKRGLKVELVGKAHYRVV